MSHDHPNSGRGGRGRRGGGNAGRGPSRDPSLSWQQRSQQTPPPGGAVTQQQRERNRVVRPHSRPQQHSHVARISGEHERTSDPPTEVAWPSLASSYSAVSTSASTSHQASNRAAHPTSTPTPAWIKPPMKKPPAAVPRSSGANDRPEQQSSLSLSSAATISNRTSTQRNKTFQKTPPPSQTKQWHSMRSEESSSVGRTIIQQPRESIQLQEFPPLGTSRDTVDFPPLGGTRKDTNTTPKSPPQQQTQKAPLAQPHNSRVATKSSKKRPHPTSTPQETTGKRNDVGSSGPNHGSKKRGVADDRARTVASLPQNNHSTNSRNQPATTNTAHHHELNKPLVDMNTISIRKGRQRLGPQKKRLTTLKKKVLQERLRIWRELNPESVSSSEAKTTSNVQSLSSPVPTHDMDDVRHYYAASSSVCLLNFVQPEDDLDDEEEYQETVSDLKDLALKIGPVREVHILRSGSRYSFVAFSRHLDAQAAAAMWDKMIIGGNKLDATVICNPPLGILDNDDSNSESIHQEAHKSWLDFMTQAATSVAHSNTSPQNIHSAVDTFPPATTEDTHSIVLENILTQEDLDDEPESLAESLQDITTLANQFGRVAHVKMDENRGGHAPLIHVSYHGDVNVAERAVQQLNGMIIGGETVLARLSFGSKDKTVSESHVTIILSGVLTEDDFEDEDCLQESIEDIRNTAQQFGQVVHVKAELQGENKGSVLVKYQGDQSIAEAIVEGFRKTVMGGQPISARCLNPSSQLHSATAVVLSTTVVLLNILKPEDFESEECLDESLDDIQSIARDKCGQVTNLKVERTKNEAGIVHISFKDRQEAEKALEEFNGMVIGGEKVIAQIKENALSELLPILEVNMVHTETDKSPAFSQLSEGEQIKLDAPPPMFSGDKIIPERYAECKRVPKVPNAAVSREYANMRIGDDGAIPLLVDMLGELSRLQNRAKLDKNARARRRFVMGLREVARGIRAHKIIMVIMANNLDEYGALDVKLQEILDLAEAQEEPVPIVFELNKRKLGKALGKSIKVSVVGIQNADGANQQFKQLKKMAVNKRMLS